MSSASDSSPERAGRQIAASLAAICGLIGLCAIVGTVFHLPVLAAALPGAVAIKFNAAVGLVVAAAGLLLLAFRRKRAANAAFVAVLALGVVHLAQDAFGLDLGIDELVVSDPPGSPGTAKPGRMSPVDAVSFVLTGAAGLLIGRQARSAVLIGQALCVALFAIALHILFGYACNIAEVYSSGPFTATALNTAAAFGTLAPALVFADTRHGLGAVLAADSVEGAQLRRVLPIAVIVPLLFDFLAVQGMNAGLYEARGAIALVLTGGAMLALAIVGLTIRTMQRIDAQRRAALEETAASADLFRSTFEQAFIGMANIDLHGRWLLVNDRLCHALGRGRDRLIGQNALDLLSPGQARRVRARARRLMRGSDGSLRGEFPLDLPNRGRRWFDVRLTLHRDRAQRPLHFLFIAMDVTDRKQAMEQLRISARILDSVACGVVVTDARMPGEPITYVNEEFVRITGYTAEEVLGRGFPSLSEGQLERSELDELRRAFRSSQPCVIEICQQRKDGTPFWNRMMVSPVRDAAGVLTHRVGILLDVTAARKAAQERDELLASAVAARSAAEVAMRARDALLAVVSHELRGPLNTIRLWASVLLTEEPKVDTVTRAARHIDSAVDVQSRLIADLIDVSRIASGRLEIQREPQEVGSLVAEAVEAALPSARQAAVDVRFQGADGAVFASVDRARLDQVLKNLLGNAIKFTPPGGHVSVRVITDDEHMHVHVEDDGRGIDPTDLPLVFQPFWQADSRDTRLRGGMGLGLHIVKYIVEQHGGTVTAASDGLGRGSRFSFSIPTMPAEVACPAPPRDAEGHAMAPAEGTGVLVVDDDAPTAEAMALALRFRGYDARTAHSVDEALDVLEGFPVRVLVSDLMMPERSGFELIEEIRRQERELSRPRMFAVAISGHGGSDRDRIRSAGFDQFIAKPADIRLLVTTIQRALGTVPAAPS